MRDRLNLTVKYTSMNHTLRNALALMAGLIAAFVFNSVTLQLLGSLTGMEAQSEMTPEEIANHLKNLKPWQFAVPFAAHVLGSFAGGFIAASLSKTQPKVLAVTVALIHLAGGVAMVMAFPHPIWFVILDLTLAYVPIAWLAYKVVRR